MENAIKDEEIEQLEEHIAGLECELQRRYCQMGKELLELADGELKAVNSLVDDIIETRRKLALAKHEIQCADCMAFNTPDSNFCKRCGSLLHGQDDTDTENAKNKEIDNGR